MNSAQLLEGYSVRLEPLSLDHIDALSRIALDPSNWIYMTLRPKTADDVRAMVEQSLAAAATGSEQPWVTFVGDEPAGGSRLLDIQPQHRTAEIGYTWLATPWRGSGVNPRVKLLQLTYSFETLQLRRVALKTHHENFRSQRAMLKLGAKYEGEFRNHMIMPDGSARHSRWYSITAEEWPGVKAQLIERVANEPVHARHA